jgi:hypothetical protein
MFLTFLTVGIHRNQPSIDIDIDTGKTSEEFFLDISGEDGTYR